MGRKLVEEFLAEVSRIFEKLNFELFGGRLVAPSFRWSPQKKYSVRFESTEDGDEEIIIGEGIREETSLGFTIEIIREMIHLDHHRRNIIGRTSNQYHNRKFMDSALQLGFWVGRSAKGWNELSVGGGKGKDPGAAAARRLEGILGRSAFDESTLRSLQEKPSGRKSRKFQYKFICDCPPPHNSIRSGRRPDHARALQARCLVCGGNFRFTP